MALTTVKAAGIAADSIDETKIADNGIDSEHYNDQSIDHEHLADDAVDADILADNSVGLAAMAGIARGKLIVGNASGDPAYLAAGSNDHVLTMDANGDVGWEAAAGGTTINNATANELVTVASSTDELDAEANLTFDGTKVVLGGQTARTLDGYHGSLQIEGTTDATTAMSIIRNSNDNHPPSLNFGKSKGGANGSATTVADASNLGQITFKAADGTDMECEGARIEATSWSSQAGNNTPAALRFYVNKGAASSTEVGRFVPNGNLEISDGDIKIGTAGHGIDFSASAAGSDSASQTTELLSDYEEGTFNIIINTHQGTPDVTYTTQVGKYCKVGRNVTVHGSVAWNDIDGEGGYPRIEGLPCLGAINGANQPSLHFSNIDGYTAGTDQGTESDWTWASMWIGNNNKNGTPWRMKWGGNYPLQTSGGCQKNQGSMSFTGTYIAYQAS